MKDLDFDELDKAVHSMAFKANKTKSTSPTPAVKKEPEVALSAPEVSSPITEQNSSSSTQLSPPPSPRPRSQDTAPAPRPTVTPGHRSARLGVKPITPPLPRGSFIDVVTPKPKPQASKPPMREAPPVNPVPTVRPLNTLSSASQPKLDDAGLDALSVVNAEKKVAATMPESSTPKVSPSVKPPIAEHAPVSSKPEDWPDPLDFHEEFTAPKTQPEPTTTSSTSYAPAVSPFLPDAKVEKRPLGSFASQMHQSPKAPVDSVSTPAAYTPGPEPSAVKPVVTEEPVFDSLEDSETKPQPASTQPELPQSIEQGLPTPESHSSDNQAQQLISEPSFNTAEFSEDSKNSKSEAEQQVRDSALLSIPQQYKREDKPSNEAERPVFDTTQYHPPLLEATSHGHRNNTGLKIIFTLLIIVILVVVGYFTFQYIVNN